MQHISAGSVQRGVHELIPYLEGTAHKAVYFEGWNGLGASAVLRAIAEHPPPSLWEKFDKIIHIDCTRWKSRRALQRAISMLVYRNSLCKEPKGTAVHLIDGKAIFAN